MFPSRRPPPLPSTHSFTLIKGQTSTARGLKTIASLASNTSALALSCTKTPGCVAFDTAGALKSSADTKQLAPLDAKPGQACSGMYVANNSTSLLKRLFGNAGAVRKQAQLLSSSKAAAASAKELRDVVKTFKASAAGQKQAGVCYRPALSTR